MIIIAMEREKGRERESEREGANKLSKNGGKKEKSVIQNTCLNYI